MTSITILDNTESISTAAEAVTAFAVAFMEESLGCIVDDGEREDVLDEIADIFRSAILSPEDMAMLQALYSRSPASVTEHLKKVRSVGAGEFMGKFYVGYGHASIGDCGNTTIFIEGVSMLAAKAIQDWPLYSGQEASTRYMDFSEAVFENPADSEAGAVIQERWRSFYIESMPAVQLHLIRKYPRRPEEDEKSYVRAIAARCFDVMRAFLPAGAHTNLSWSTNLRQASDKLMWLRHHPDRSIGDLADGIFTALKESYGHSFSREREEVADYVRDAMGGYFLGPGEATAAVVPINTAQVAEHRLSAHTELLKNRPRGAPLPHWLGDSGIIDSEFLLDFGSFRDLQRHRAGVVRMPMLTTRLGFHPWYLGELPSDVRANAELLIGEQERAIEAMGLSPVVAQSYVAMGFQVACRVTQPIPAFVYRLELRSSKTVHPTLRQVILQEAAWFRRRFPNIAIHIDDDPDSWTVRRGTQTIEEK